MSLGAFPQLSFGTEVKPTVSIVEHKPIEKDECARPRSVATGPVPAGAARAVGVVLAAGASSRMAPDFKPLLDLGGATVLARCVETLRAGGAADVLVVTGHRAQEVAAEAGRLGAATVHNPAWREGGMFSSVCAGLAAVAGRADDSGALLLPVDAALVRPVTVRLLLERASLRPGRVLLPVFDGQWGHPPLLPAALVPIVLTDSGEGGLRGALHRLEAGTREELAVPDRFILRDMDTPRDYRAARADWPTREVPTPCEARALLAARSIPPGGIAHAEGVAAVAVRLVDALSGARNGGNSAPGVRLDRDLAEAAALLHDIAKGQPRHETAGGALLRELGFSGVADMVAAHRDTTLPDDHPLTERELVYFADKLVRCHMVVDVEARFGEKLAQWRHEPEAAAAIEGRMQRALALRARLEAEAGCPLPDMLFPLRIGLPAWEPAVDGAGAHSQCSTGAPFAVPSPHGTPGGIGESGGPGDPAGPDGQGGEHA